MKIMYKIIAVLLVMSLVPVLIMGYAASVSMEEMRNAAKAKSGEGLMDAEKVKLVQMATDKADALNNFFLAHYRAASAMRNYWEFINRNYSEFKDAYNHDFYPDKNHTGLPGYGYIHPDYGTYADYDDRVQTDPWAPRRVVNRTLVDPAYAAEISKQLHMAMLFEPLFLSTWKSHNASTDLVWLVFDSGVTNVFPPYNYLVQIPENPEVIDANESEEDYVRLLNPENNPERNILWLSPYLDLSKRIWMTSCVTPLYDNDTFMGTAGLDILLTTLTNDVLKVSVGRTGYAFLMDSKGVVVAMPSQGIDDLVWDAQHKKALQEILKPPEEQNWTEAMEKAIYENPMNKTPNRELQGVFTSMISRVPGISQVQISGRDKFIAYAPINNTGWSIGIVVPLDEVTAPAEEVSRTILEVFAAVFGLVFFVVFVTCVVAGVSLGYHITSPIRRLTALTKRVSMGEDIDKEIEVKTKDEIAELGENFNRMLRGMKAAVHMLEMKENPVDKKEKPKG
ncbi:MAG: cache domain-containing protein [Thermoplasmata archaeon]|nr:cache domain-containing protein [Thermoplasmata archaeon]